MADTTTAQPAGRGIFITGSSTGLGRAAAQLFASRGWRVIATMRQPDRDTSRSGGVLRQGHIAFCNGRERYDGQCGRCVRP